MLCALLTDLSLSTISLCVRPWQVHARIVDVDAGVILSSTILGLKLKLSLNAGRNLGRWNSNDDVGVDLASSISSRWKRIIEVYRLLLLWRLALGGGVVMVLSTSFRVRFLCDRSQ